MLMNFLRFLQGSEIFDPLQPLQQVSMLLQSRKSEEDVQTICDLCSNLTTAQVLKVNNTEHWLDDSCIDNFASYFKFQIVKSYTLDDCEAPITPKFITTLSNKLNERENNVRYSTILLSDHIFILGFISLQTSSEIFTMDENFVNPVKVVYKYDETKLEEIELPTILNLDTLLTKI